MSARLSRIGGVTVHAGAPAATVLEGLLPESYALVTSAGGARRIEAMGLLGNLPPPAQVILVPPGLLTQDRLDALPRPKRGAAILAIGGGTVLDAAKLMRHAAGERLIALPTTAGSGSELTATASLWDGGRKRSVEDAALQPDDALYDPALLVGAPEEVRLAAAWDATSHALESLWSRHACAQASRLAAEALAILLRVFETGSVMDDAQLPKLVAAAALAGAAIAETRTGIAHALSYEMTARHAVPHGLAAGLMAVATASLLGEAAEPIAAIDPKRLGAAWRNSGANTLAFAYVSPRAILDSSDALDPSRADLSAIPATAGNILGIRRAAAGILEEAA